MPVLSRKELEEKRRAGATTPALCEEPKSPGDENLKSPETPSYIYTFFHPDCSVRNLVNSSITVNGVEVDIVNGVVTTTDDKVARYLEDSGYSFVKKEGLI